MFVLERLGNRSRSPTDPNDGRITPSGLTRYWRLDKLLFGVQNKLLVPLTASEHELQVQFLNHILAASTDPGPEARPTMETGRGCDSPQRAAGEGSQQ